MYILEHWIELVGYLGSFLVALSLMMKSITRLRKINLVGASTFAFYGFLVGAYPVLLLNGFISLVDIYYLVQMRRQKDYFELLPIRTRQSPFLNRFLEFYQSDIQYFFPEFSLKEDRDYVIIFVLRNLLPVSLFIAEKQENQTLKICLDYSIPQYRDLQNAHYLYQKPHALFREMNYKCAIAHTTVSEHARYLQAVGFKKDNTLGTNWFKKEI